MSARTLNEATDDRHPMMTEQCMALLFHSLSKGTASVPATQHAKPVGAAGQIRLCQTSFV